MIYLSADDIIRIHDRIVVRTGGIPGVLSRGLVDSAAARPQATFEGQELYPTVWLKAAALLESLAQNHGFADANKRTAWLTTKLFLRRNGKDLRATKEQAVSFMLLVAQRQLTLEQIAFWLEGAPPRDPKGGISVASSDPSQRPSSPSV